jgi:hypothetical protein
MGERSAASCNSIFVPAVTFPTQLMAVIFLPVLHWPKP